MVMKVTEIIGGYHQNVSQQHTVKPVERHISSQRCNGLDIFNQEGRPVVQLLFKFSTCTETLQRGTVCGHEG